MELQTVSDVREFFRAALQAALEHQHLHVHDHTEHYIVNVLAMFSHTDALDECDADRTQIKPLAGRSCEKRLRPLGISECLRTRPTPNPMTSTR